MHDVLFCYSFVKHCKFGLTPNPDGAIIRGVGRVDTKPDRRQPNPRHHRPHDGQPTDGAASNSMGAQQSPFEQNTGSTDRHPNPVPVAVATAGQTPDRRTIYTTRPKDHCQQRHAPTGERSPGFTACNGTTDTQHKTDHRHPDGGHRPPRRRTGRRTATTPGQPTGAKQAQVVTVSRTTTPQRGTGHHGRWIASIRGRVQPVRGGNSVPTAHG